MSVPGLAEASTLPGAPPTVSPARAALVRRARLLAWGGNVWHALEFAIALAAGVAAGSVALVAFGVDSLIELFAGSVIVWRLGARRIDSLVAERRAQRIVAASYFILTAYIIIESARTLLAGDRPETSWVGIVLAGVTAPTMPLLARAKRRVGIALGSSATASEGTQNMICAYLSLALLVGLTANALAGWWWADPVAAIIIGIVAGREGIDQWRGETACGCCQPVPFDGRRGHT